MKARYFLPYLGAFFLGCVLVPGTPAQQLSSALLPDAPGIAAETEAADAQAKADEAQTKAVQAQAQAATDAKAVSEMKTSTALDSASKVYVAQEASISAHAQEKAADYCHEMLRQAQAKGYDVLLYDASTGETLWSAANLPNKDPVKVQDPLDPNVKDNKIAVTAHTQDLLMVQVCHIRFDSTVNVSATAVSVGDRGLDIRGTTPTTAVTTPTTTTDALQTALSNASNSALAATLPLPGAPPAFAGDSIVVLGSTKGAAYTPLSVTATPEDFARAVRAYQAEASAVLVEMQGLCSVANECSRNGIDTDYASPSTMGTVLDIYSRGISFRRDLLSYHKEDYQLSDIGLFDRAKAEAQQFSVVLSALDSKIAAANLSTQLPVLAANYRALAGGLFTIREVEETDRRLVGNRIATCPYVPSDATTRQSQTAAKGKAATDTKPEQDTTDTTSTTAIQSEENLLDGEYCYAQIYDRELSRLGVRLTANEIEGVVTPDQLFSTLSELHSDLEAINSEVNGAFSELNNWYKDSQTYFADVLTPNLSNAALRVGVSAVETYVPFTLSFSPATAPGSSSSATAVSGHFPSTTLVEVQRHVSFNVVGGVLWIGVPTASYSLVESTVSQSAMPFAPCGGTMTVTPTTGTNYYCPVPSSSSNYQVAGITALNWIPWGRNYYPSGKKSAPVGTFTSVKSFGKAFGLMAGTSVTSLGTVFLGGDFEPFYGLDIYGGRATAHEQTLMPGTPASGVYTVSTAPVESSLKWGWSGGIGFDVSVLTQIFKAGTPSQATAP